MDDEDLYNYEPIPGEAPVTLAAVVSKGTTDGVLSNTVATRVEPTRQYAAPMPDLLAMFVFRLWKHPQWSTIRSAVRKGEPNARVWVEWLSWKMDNKLMMQIQSRYEGDPQAFIRQQRTLFETWPKDSQDGLARAVLYFQTKEERMLNTPPRAEDEPSKIIKVTR